VAPTPNGETKSAQYAAGLVGVEVGPVEARNQADHLFGGEPPAANDYEVVSQRLRHDVAKQPPNLSRVKRVFLLCDPGLYLIHTYRIALTVLSRK
jgi:hypothetical protein